MTYTPRVLAANLLCRADALPDTRRHLRMGKTLVMAGGCVKTPKGTVVSLRTEGMAGGTREPFDQSATGRPPVLPLNLLFSLFQSILMPIESSSSVEIALETRGR